MFGVNGGIGTKGTCVHYVDKGSCFSPQTLPHLSRNEGVIPHGVGLAFCKVVSAIEAATGMQGQRDMQGRCISGHLLRLHKPG